MVPAARSIPCWHSLVPLLEAGDIVIDGGNSYYHDDIRRAGELKAKGMHYVDVGVSGGVWGLERGYCHMIGGEPEVVKHLDPIFRSLAPGVDAAPRTPGATGEPSQAEQGYLHCGPNGAGHFVKMVHNGIEYGLMAAYAEGLQHHQARQCRPEEAGGRRRNDAAAKSRALSATISMWRRSRRSGGAAASSAPGCSISPPARCARARSGELRRPRFGFRRGPLDVAGGHRRGRPGAGHQRGAVRPLQLARRGRIRRQAALGDAFRVRRPCRKAEGRLEPSGRSAIATRWSFSAPPATWPTSRFSLRCSAWCGTRA